jgi:hypothetical protein
LYSLVHASLYIRRFLEYKQFNRNKQIMSSMTTPLTLLGIAFVLHIASTILGFLFLDSFASLLSQTLFIVLLVLAAWVGCQV